VKKLTYVKILFIWLIIIIFFTFMALIDKSNNDSSISVMTSLVEKIIHLLAMQFVITFLYFIILGTGCIIFDFSNWKKNLILTLLPIVNRVSATDRNALQ
jgi:hypothetical protein